MTDRSLLCRILTLALIVVSIPVHLARAAAKRAPVATSTTAPYRDAANSDLAGTVTDTTSGAPIQSAEVSVRNPVGATIRNTTTDAFGRFTVHNLPPGSYSVLVHLIGYAAITRPVTIGATTTPPRMSFAMTPISLNLQAMQVTATAPIAVDTHTGDQLFQASEELHGAPTVTTSQILQQSIVGAARAPTGEVHVRGQHAEYTYYIDGVPVPSGISGSLNELFDPEVVNSIDFQTGGWDAEYGNKNAAIVNVTTKIPPGSFHASASTFVGAYDHSATAGPTGFNGQTLSLSGNNGPWGMYIAGSRQFSDMRREPVVFDTSGNRIINFHNDGTDGYAFGKLQYSSSPANVIALEANIGETKPPSRTIRVAGCFRMIIERDINSFVNLGWNHQFGTQTTGAGSSELFAGLFYRHGSLTYDPNPQDDLAVRILPGYHPSEPLRAAKLQYVRHQGRLYDSARRRLGVQIRYRVLGDHGP